LIEIFCVLVVSLENLEQFNFNGLFRLLNLAVTQLSLACWAGGEGLILCRTYLKSYKNLHLFPVGGYTKPSIILAILRRSV